MFRCVPYNEGHMDVNSYEHMHVVPVYYTLQCGLLLCIAACSYCRCGYGYQCVNVCGFVHSLLQYNVSILEYTPVCYDIAIHAVCVY